MYTSIVGFEVLSLYAGRPNIQIFLVGGMIIHLANSNNKRDSGMIPTYVSGTTQTELTDW